jgi:hypothetical protein
MIQHLLAQLDAARLSRRQRDLRRREQDAIARLGATTLAEGGPREGRLSTLAAEAATVRRRLAALSTENRAGGARRDQRHETLEAKLLQLHLIAGRLALAMPGAGGGAEVQAIRDELAEAASDQERIRADSQRLAEDSWADLQAWVRPRAPMLSAMVVGWWAARSYAAANTPAILTAFGRSTKTRGAHWISLTTDTAIVRYGLPLLAAAVCAYLGHRLAARLQASVAEYRDRASERAQTRAGSRAGSAHEPAMATERAEASRDTPGRTAKAR